MSEDDVVGSSSAVRLKDGLAIPRVIYDELASRTDGACPVPRCGAAAVDVVVLDGDPANITIDNLILVCSAHHARSVDMGFKSRVLATVRNLLSEPDARVSAVLTPRHAMLSELVQRLDADPSTLRINYVGPLFCHPDWYHERRDALEGYKPNLERSFREYLRRHDGRSAEIRIVLRNATRYRAKVLEVVRPHERDRFLEETLNEINSIWGVSNDRGPMVACIEMGFFRHPIIFDDSVVEIARAAPGLPTQSAILHTDPAFIEWERRNFDSVFDFSSRGQDAELAELRRFVTELFV